MRLPLNRFKAVLISGSVLLMLLTSCAHRRAKGLLTDGNYAGAINAYEEILRDDPEDGDALKGLRQARNKFISAELIRIRMLRLARQQAQATAKLETLLVRHDKWEVSQSYPYYQSLKMETGHGIEYVTSQLQKDLKSGYPLRVALTTATYPKILFSHGTSPRWESIRDQTRTIATTLCYKKRSHSANREVFHREYLNRFCSYWGIHSNRWQYEDDRYADLIVNPKALEYTGKRIPPNLMFNIQEALQTAFKNSLLYSPDSSKSLTLDLVMSYGYQDQVVPKQFSKLYQEEVPYESSESYYQATQIPETRYKEVQNCVQRENGACKKFETINIPQTYYVNRQVKMERPIVKYRMENRTYQFSGLSHHESFKLQVNLAGKSIVDSLAFTYLQTGSHQFDAHGVFYPKAGVHPLPEDFANLDTWLQAQAAGIAEEFSSRIIAGWKQTYCTKNSEEARLRCLAADDSFQPANSWFQREFGVSYPAAQQLLAANVGLFQYHIPQISH